MTVDQQMKHVKTFLGDCWKVLGDKSLDYAPEDIVLLDVVRSAAYSGIRPAAAMYLHLEKHVTAVRRYCATGKVTSEPIHGRFVDLINHASLIHFFIENEEVIRRDVAQYILTHDACTCTRGGDRCDRCCAVVNLANRELPWD